MHIHEKCQQPVPSIQWHRIGEHNVKRMGVCGGKGNGGIVLMVLFVNPVQALRMKQPMHVIR
jgi:hypothetical protein